MRIALIGYGRMGRTIETVAQERGHEIVFRGDMGWSVAQLPKADAAIEFTTPQTAEENVSLLLDKGLPVVSGTTGWDTEAMRHKSEKTGVPFIWSSNFSVGVNLFFALNKRLAELMKGHGYQPSITEIHHIHKLDKPSGTAKTLATAIGEDIPIESIREGEVAGVHSVRWDSAADTITITHEAKSRKGFALGAVLAAEWLQGKEGPHTMTEVLNLRP